MCRNVKVQRIQRKSVNVMKLVERKATFRHREPDNTIHLSFITTSASTFVFQSLLSALSWFWIPAQMTLFRRTGLCRPCKGQRSTNDQTRVTLFPCSNHNGPKSLTKPYLIYNLYPSLSTSLLRTETKLTNHRKKTRVPAVL
jgi:hypothetical protein